LKGLFYNRESNCHHYYHWKNKQIKENKKFVPLKSCTEVRLLTSS